ncbi:MAG: tetratricopeptide repeat protein [Acidobacteria bacterium]|nr:tetratricopeptide repeat protein [Acidobacteriota bacterium]
MKELEDLLVNRNENVPLDVALLQIASVEYPDLDVTWFVEVLDSYARELAETTHTGMRGEEWLEAANSYLYGNLGFRGNQDDYYNARNSCLNDVLAERTGIPLTLCVVYMEIARRLGREMSGIGLPRHFLAHYSDGRYSTYVDCFHGGRPMTTEEVRDFGMEIAQIDVVEHPQYLAPVTKFQIAVRTLDNLRHVYYLKKDYAKAVRVLDLYLAAKPGAAEEYKQRGFLLLTQKRPAEALRDLQRYVKLLPDAEDRSQVEEQMQYIRSFLRSLN